MQQALQITALAVIAVILAKIVQARAFDVMLLLALCAAILTVCVKMLQPLLTFARELQEQVGLETALLTPLWKVLSITLICRVGAGICSDAGQKAVGDLVMRGGGLMALCAAIPLMQAVLEVVKSLTGGMG